MEKRVNDFVKEFTDNFSELYVESFFIKYLSEYDKKDLLETIQLTNKKMQQKIIKLFMNNLIDMNIDKEDIAKYLN